MSDEEKKGNHLAILSKVLPLPCVSIRHHGPRLPVWHSMHVPSWERHGVSRLLRALVVLASAFFFFWSTHVLGGSVWDVRKARAVRQLRKLRHCFER